MTHVSDAAPADVAAAPPGAGRRLRRLSGTGRAGAWRRLATALAAGAVTFLAFPPVGAWFLAPVGVAALVLALRGRRLRAGFGLGLAYGLAFFVPLLGWISPIGVDVWLGLAFAQAVFSGVLGAGGALLTRARGWPVWFAAWWIAVDALRSRWPLGGFPWGRLAFSQSDGPLLPYAAVGGAPLVSFVVALAGCLLAAVALRAATSRSAPRAVRRPAASSTSRGGLVAAVAGLAVLASAWAAVPLPTAGQTTGGPASATIAVIQGNVPRLGLAAYDQWWNVTINHAEATHELAAAVRAGTRPRPDVVLWPENATDVDPRHDPGFYQLIADAVDDVDAPTLVGAVLDGPGDGLSNAGLVWNPGEYPTVGYVKRHLVPFGEYVPFRAELTGLIGRLGRIRQDMIPGHGDGLVRLGPVRLSDVICYEVAYDGLVRGDVTAGGRMIVVQTNNASYTRNETVQQLAMARLRAVEHGRSVAVAATSGISALIEPDGTLAARSGFFTRAVLDRSMPLRDSLTISDRVGALPEWLLTGLGAGALLVTAATTRRRRKAQT